QSTGTPPTCRRRGRSGCVASVGGASVAGQLLLQRGQRLVGGQGPGGLLGGGAPGLPATAVVTAVAAALRQRPGGLDLPLVLLPPLAGLGVLPLPLLTLLLVARQPLPGVGVEALRVDVVALGVV